MVGLTPFNPLQVSLHTLPNFYGYEQRRLRKAREVRTMCVEGITIRH